MKTRYRAMEVTARIVQRLRLWKYRVQGYKNIHRSAILESDVLLDRVFPQGVHVGENTLIASRATVLAHEHIRRDPEDARSPWVKDTYIGKRCFIGVGAVILPGVKIGDEVVVGAATVVTKDVPSNSMVVGNPGRVLDRKIRLTDRAVLADGNS